MNRLYLIAELGVNFFDTASVMKISPLQAAKLYIDEAKKSGVDCIKLQAYKAEKIASRFSPAYWDTTKEPTLSQYELFKKFDAFEEKDYCELADYTHEMKMDFTATPFDYEAADYLYDLVDFYKISSSDITNLPFIEYIAKKGKPVIISTGASDKEEVEKAYECLINNGCKDITIMHCVLSYPTLYKDANLSMITSLIHDYPDCKVGYSDHVAPDDSMLTVTAAYTLGASVIEKHFTLDKTLTGNDHYHAGNPDDFMKARMNCDFIVNLMGQSERTVLECEQMSRKQARRSLVAVRDIKKGEMIKTEDITAKRPGTGISPDRYDEVINHRALCDIVEDSVILPEMIECI